jgi:2,5-diketo-D-gluconate reductase B
MLYRTIKGLSIPALGLGTFGLKGDDGVRALRDALEIGYRHIDTAQFYANEDAVGEALAGSGIPRESLFVTTKVWPTNLSDDKAPALVEESLRKLKTEYVDLLLIHWPNPDIPVGQTLALFKGMKERGLARNIGVSNFPIALLREALATHGADLVVNQVEYHPFLNQQPMIDTLARHDMLLTAYMPLAKGRAAANPTIQAIAHTHGKSPEQVTLRWLVQQDHVAAIPRSSRVENLRANFDIFDFALSAEDMSRISALRGGGRLANPAWAPAWDAA